MRALFHVVSIVRCLLVCFTEIELSSLPFGQWCAATADLRSLPSGCSLWLCKCGLRSHPITLMRWTQKVLWKNWPQLTQLSQLLAWPTVHPYFAPKLLESTWSLLSLLLCFFEWPTSLFDLFEGSPFWLMRRCVWRFGGPHWSASGLGSGGSLRCEGGQAHIGKGWFADFCRHFFYFFGQNTWQLAGPNCFNDIFLLAFAEFVDLPDSNLMTLGTIHRRCFFMFFFDSIWSSEIIESHGTLAPGWCPAWLSRRRPCLELVSQHWPSRHQRGKPRRAVDDLTTCWYRSQCLMVFRMGSQESIRCFGSCLDVDLGHCPGSLAPFDRPYWQILSCEVA